MKVLFTSLLCFFFVCHAQAQSGAISGRVLDGTKEPIEGAVIKIIKDGRLVNGSVTDFDGNYLIKPIPVGVYTAQASFVGHKDAIVKNIIVTADKTTEVSFSLYASSAAMLDEVVVVDYVVPLIDEYAAGATTTRTAEEIEAMPTRSTTSLVSTSAGAYDGSSEYIVDGVRVYGDDGSSTAKAGHLTSGEINDFSKWELWTDITTLELQQYESVWNIYAKNRYTVMVQTTKYTPLPNAIVQLKNNDKIIWETRTDNTGKAELWYGMFDNDNSERNSLSLDINWSGKHYTIKKAKLFNQRINLIDIPVACVQPSRLDVAFIVDATGSMADEIAYLKAELLDIIGGIQDSMPDMEIRTGSVFYRDDAEEYTTRSSPLSADINATMNFIRSNSAGGGGDEPEAVDSALSAGLYELDWDMGAVARIAFLILDAPPHRDNAAYMERFNAMIKAYAAKGIRIVPISCSGIDKGTEYLMRCAALATNGTYLFLTDHSGIGGKHIEPTTDKYEVELMNDIIRRVIYQFSVMPSCDIRVVNETDTGRVLINEQTIVDSSLDIVEKDVAAEQTLFSYWPNPTHGMLYVDSKGVDGEIYICDVSGKLIMKFKNKGQKPTKIDMTTFPTGNYFVRFVTDGTKPISGKFVLVR